MNRSNQPSQASDGGGLRREPDISHRQAPQHWYDRLQSVDRWWTVLLLLFGVTGVLGLPVLWISRSYGIGMKAVLSILVTAYTGLLLWAVYLIWVMVYHSATQGGF